MSNRWPAGIIRKTPVTPAGPLQNGVASGVWSLADAAYWTKQGLWPTAGNFLAVEDVFSTYLYTGNGSTQTITNGINLSGSGGLVWVKPRNATGSHLLRDTVRGGTKLINTDTTGAEQTTDAYPLGNGVQFDSNGFSLGPGGAQNGNGFTFASWTFREAPKFFDVVTYTGTGANRTIAHNLGVAPGMIIVKRTSTSGNDWQVYHRSLANTQYMALNTTAAVATGATRWNSTTPTATDFTVGTDNTVNNNGSTYVAYLFAHDATADGIIQCGSYAGTGAAGQVATLGWEPQWVMIKATNTATDWQMYDTMRGMTTLSDGTVRLNANTSGAESGPFGGASSVFPTATGFGAGGGIEGANQGGGNYIYVAIRRGPMRTPTLGTSVLSVKNYAATTTSASVTHDVTFDVEINANRDVSTAKFLFVDSLRGINGVVLRTGGTTSESTFPTYWSRNGQRGMYAPSAFDSWWASSSGTNNHISYGLVRAPGFMDVVCYTGTSASRGTISHNLGVAPELMIVKRRNSAQEWPVYAASLGINAYARLNYDYAAFTGYGLWDGVSPTATNFTVLQSGQTFESGGTYVAYLFASAPGVSKVGSYTGTGALQTINCAFTTGARFVMIKRTDSTGDWFVWDSTRGITSGNDPYMVLNSFDPEVTGTNYVDTDTTGFKVTAAAPAGINANGGTYIFLAIA